MTERRAAAQICCACGVKLRSWEATGGIGYLEYFDVLIFPPSWTEETSWRTPEGQAAYEAAQWGYMCEPCWMQHPDSEWFYWCDGIPLGVSEWPRALRSGRRTGKASAAEG